MAKGEKKMLRRDGIGKGGGTATYLKKDVLQGFYAIANANADITNVQLF